MTILTNVVFFFFSAFYFRNLKHFHHPYASQMGWFIFLLGVSSIFGAVAHAVHYQLGTLFFSAVFFLMNFFSLFSIYFCFRALYTYANLHRETSKMIYYIGIVWLVLLSIVMLVYQNFLVIKIHAAVVLICSLAVHLTAYIQNKEKGSRLVATGIIISFLSIIVHTVKFSLHRWLNYKDIAHVIMIISLIFIYKGIRLNLLLVIPEVLKREKEIQEVP